MFKCNDCGARFVWPKAVEEARGEYWGMPCSEWVYYCPMCGRWDFEEIHGDEEAGGNMWVSYYLQDGTQGGATITADTYEAAEKWGHDEYGEAWGGIADYGFYEDLERG